MRLIQRTATAALVAAGFALAVPAATMSAQAAPAAASAASTRAISTNSEIVQVQDGRRRHHDGRRNHRHHRGGHNDGWGNSGAYLGLGIAGAIIGGALSEGYDDGPGYSDGVGYSGDSSGAMQRCASQFRSFEWDTGLYTTYAGEKRLCPYLG